MELTTAKLTYWVVPRFLLRTHSLDFTYHRALINYMILFTGPIIIREDDLVNNPPLRHQLRQENSFLFELAERGLIHVAIQYNNDERLPLSEFAAKLKTSTGRNYYQGLEAYDDVTEVENFIQRATTWSFSGEEHDQFFTNNALKLIKKLQQNSIEFRGIDKSFSKIFQSVADKIINEQGFLRWSDFVENGDAWNAISKTEKGRIIKKDSRVLYDMFRAAYVGFLPSHIESDAAYSFEDAPSFDLLKDRVKVQTQEIERKELEVLELSASDYVRGLNLLDATDIHELRCSAVASDVEKNWLEYTTYNAKNADEIFYSLQAYRTLIDAKIVQKLRLKKESKSIVGNLSLLKKLDDSNLTSWIKLTLDAIGMIEPISGAISGSNSIYHRLRELRGSLTPQQKDIAMLKTTLNEWKTNHEPLIKSKLSYDESLNRSENYLKNNSN